MKKNDILKIVARIAVILVIIIVFVLINDQIQYNRRSSFIPKNDNSNFAYQIEDLSVDGDEIVVTGWFFELKSVMNVPREVDDSSNLSILLYDLNTEDEKNIDGTDKPKEGVPFNTERMVRADVYQYFKCDYDYSKCGFVGRLKKSEIDLENGEYQFAFKIDAEGEFGYKADAYVSKGKLMFVNPKDFRELDVQGTDLAPIVDNGYCLVSYPEYHVYIYQYEKKLYWIVDQDYPFNESEGTVIECQLDTTQFNRLPRNLIENGRYRGSIGGKFENGELTNEMNCGPYRVFARDIPREYSITRIETGSYEDGKWIWQKYFRPMFMYK